MFCYLVVGWQWEWDQIKSNEENVWARWIQGILTFGEDFGAWNISHDSIPEQTPLEETDTRMIESPFNKGRSSCELRNRRQFLSYIPKFFLTSFVIFSLFEKAVSNILSNNVFSSWFLVEAMASIKVCKPVEQAGKKLPYTSNMLNDPQSMFRYFSRSTEVP